MAIFENVPVRIKHMYYYSYILGLEVLHNRVLSNIPARILGIETSKFTFIV